jgi:hypothetical protein
MDLPVIGTRHGGVHILCPNGYAHRFMPPTTFPGIFSFPSNGLTKCRPTISLNWNIRYFVPSKTNHNFLNRDILTHTTTPNCTNKQEILTSTQQHRCAEAPGIRTARPWMRARVLASGCVASPDLDARHLTGLGCDVLPSHVSSDLDVRRLAVACLSGAGRAPSCRVILPDLDARLAGPGREVSPSRFATSS